MASSCVFGIGAQYLVAGARRRPSCDNRGVAEFDTTVVEGEVGSTAERNRKVIHATCSLHGGPAGFSNVVVTKLGGQIELDPHATGACVLRFTEDQATALSETIMKWLVFLSPPLPSCDGCCPAGLPASQGLRVKAYHHGHHETLRFFLCRARAAKPWQRTSASSKRRCLRYGTARCKQVVRLI